MRILGVLASSVFKLFTDNFNRTTSGNLGTSSGGGPWNATRGTWYANGSKAVSTDASNTYPIASADIYSTAPTVLLDVDGNGVGVSFWVSDFQNWWGVIPWQDTAVTTAYTANCNSYSQQCVAYGYFSFCAYYETYQINSRYGIFGIRCTGNYSQNGFCATYGQGCTSYTQGSSLVYSAGQRYLRLLKSVANTVTTVVDQTISAAPASISVVVNSSGQITASAYTSAGQVTQTGSSLVTTPSSPTKGTKHGIILAPGGVTQATTVDNITVKPT